MTLDDDHAMISIHALREESDADGRQTSRTTSTFQSTLSVRRATEDLRLYGASAVISIHALREESDWRIHRHLTFRREFQSTLSVRRATAHAPTMLCVVLFQSTLSVRRATRIRRECNRILKISIHALREESDGLSSTVLMMLLDFNPRSP